MLNKITIIFSIHTNYYSGIKNYFKGFNQKKQPQKQVKHFKKTS